MARGGTVRGMLRGVGKVGGREEEEAGGCGSG